jgi:predicted nucleic acid-binding protein
VRAVLIDAGPLVALLDRSDNEHEEVVATLETIRDPLVSAWPALTEAMDLLGFSWAAQEGLWEMLETGTISLLPLGAEDVPRMKQLMKKYSDLPMDLADAALVRIAERENIGRIFTLDQSDFRVYRRPRKGHFTLIP